MCLYCSPAEFTNQVDLCSNCIDQTPSFQDFSHELTHSIVKARVFIQNWVKSELVHAAWETLERAEDAFQLDQQAEEQVQDTKAGPRDMVSDFRNQFCSCCNQQRCPPCWVCIT